MNYEHHLASLSTTARTLWDSVNSDYDLTPQEQRLLLEICRTSDTLDALDADVQRNGVMRANKVNPAVVELRQTRIAFARLNAALALPDLEEDDDAPPKYQRLGTRGPYKLVKGG
ncbi:hypothetical protein ACIRVF_12000 [Kitasatospora sp. NPDC101157]|uniref:hypothetical protein n=1 Tax=Kitasatospora sp. NPDC101157 TaxID=3364098 RepID=UPI0037F2F959